jgi:hypothetical protein
MISTQPIPEKTHVNLRLHLLCPLPLDARQIHEAKIPLMAVLKEQEDTREMNK